MINKEEYIKTAHAKALSREQVWDDAVKIQQEENTNLKKELAFYKKVYYDLIEKNERLNEKLVETELELLTLKIKNDSIKEGYE